MFQFFETPKNKRKTVSPTTTPPPGNIHQKVKRSPLHHYRNSLENVTGFETILSP